MEHRPARTRGRTTRTLWRLVAAVGVALALLVVPTSASAARDTRSGIDHFVEEYLETHRLPGATVALVRDGEVVHEAGYGHDSHGDRLTPSSRLRIESVTKPITAFAVLQLVETGRVGLDDPVVDHVPEFAPDDDRADEITVRHLLSHTSGLVAPTVVRPALTLAEGVARTSDWSLASRPGSAYRYDNANYWTAARLVEVVSGKPFGIYLDDHVFAAIGMYDSVSATTTDAAVPELPRGHVMSWSMALPTSDATAMNAGAGSIISTAHDMAQWVALQQNRGVAPHGPRVLSAGLVEESHRVQPNADRAGLGWMRSAEGDPPRIQHSGVGTSHNAQVTIDPATGDGVVVLLNSFTPTQEHAYAIADGILAVAAGEDPELGSTVATWVDLALATGTLFAVWGGVRGVRHARDWARARRRSPGWRYGMRLLPQAIAPIWALFLFIVVPALEGNSYTTTDVFWLYPALMTLLIALALMGVATIYARLWNRRRVAAATFDACPAMSAAW